MDGGARGKEGKDIVDAHGHEVWKGIRFPIFGRLTNFVGLWRIARAVAIGAGNIDVRQKLHVEADRARAFAGWVAELPRIVGKRACRELLCLRGFRLCVELPQPVVDVRIRCDGRAHIDADGRGVDELHLGDAGSVDALDVRGKLAALDECFERWDEAFENQRRFPGTGNTGHDRQASFRDGDGERLHRMDSACFERDRAEIEEMLFAARRADKRMCAVVEERADEGCFALDDVGDGSFCQQRAALCSRAGAELDEVIRAAQHLRVMVDEHDGVAVRDEIVHDADEPFDVGRMEADGWLVEHVEDARCVVAHGARELRALAFTCRKRCSRAIEREVAEAEIHEPPRRTVKGIADGMRHRAHLFGKRIWHAMYPCGKIDERHGRGFGKRGAAQTRGTSLLGKACAVAVRAWSFREERLNALHAFFVLDLRERVLDGVDGVEIREVHLARCIRLFVVVEHVVLFCRTVEHEVFFSVREVSERNVRADADMVARDVFHERPHEALPRQDGTFVDRQGIVWHEFRFINRPHDARPLAGTTGTAAVEREVFRAGAVEMRTARRADDFALSRDVHGRRHHVPIRAAMAREAREHEPQAVQELCHRAERAADAGNARPLAECERRRNIADRADICNRCLRHAPPRVGRERFEIAA